MPLDSSTTPPPPKPKSTATALKADGCASLYSASLACLDRAGYDKEACQGAFDAYKACRATEVRGRFLENHLAVLIPPSHHHCLSPFPSPPLFVPTQYAAKRQARIDARRRG